MAQRRILIITHDVVDDNMAGPAIRCWEFARILSQEAEVTLATPFSSSLKPEGFRLVAYDRAKLETLAAESEAIILSSYTLWRFPFLTESTAPLIVDIYDPFLLETLPLLAGEPQAERQRRHVEILDALTDLLTWGDYFLCASERQRDYWLGWLNALDRVNPTTYDEDPTLRRLIDVVAFGLPDSAPHHTHAVLKGVHPGIAKTDHVVVWAGGIYDWFDPLTLIRAMVRVSQQRDDVKLVFLGTQHPNPDVDQVQRVEQTLALSKELGLYEKTVFFNDWTPYEERQNYLLEADVGVSLHFAHLETHFSFRTRLLDHLWTALPTIVTRGDVLSDLIRDQDLGWVVDYESAQDVAEAILQSTSVPRHEFEGRFVRVTPQFRWERVMEPLITFCRHPRHAVDRERARRGLPSLPALKLLSQLNALRRSIDARDDRVAFLDNVLRERESTIAELERRTLSKETEAAQLREEVKSLRHELQEIRQGRVMRLLNGINHILKGTALR